MKSRLLSFILVTVLASVFSLAAQAASMIQVEVVVFRHANTPLVASLPPSHNWATGASVLIERNEVPAFLNDAVAKLTPDQGYAVLLHKAWRQNLTGNTADLAFKMGQPRFELSPIQGRLQVSLGDQITVTANFWVNQFDEQGQITASEHIDQTFKVRPNEVRYLDHSSLGALVRISTL